MKKYINMVVGSFIIAISYNIFFKAFNFTPSSLLGVSTLLNFKFDIDAHLSLIILNIIFLIISFIFLKEKKTYKYILPSMLIPIFLFLTNNIVFLLDIFNLDKIILVISGSFLISLGYSMIYKNNFSVPGSETINEIFYTKYNKVSNIFVYIFDLILILLTAYFISVERGIYSIIIMVSIHYAVLKVKIGISSSKTFYIITSEDKLVKDYIVNVLKHDYTEFQTKGGFTRQNKKIIMTSIDTKHYYKLKENILNIDEHAFITIADSFEVINKNKNIV